MPGKCKFNNDWLGIAKYKAWLCCVPGNRHKASCKICHKTFDIGNMGESAIGSHAKGKVHRKNVTRAAREVIHRNFNRSHIIWNYLKFRAQISFFQLVLV